jgi:hypothetical protein
MKTKLLFILCACSFATFSQQELIQNGSFEQGGLYWDFTLSGDDHVGNGICDASDGVNYLWFGSYTESNGWNDIYSIFSQDVTLPSNLDSAEFSFYWSGGSYDNTFGGDNVLFWLYDQAGNEFYFNFIENTDMDVSITASECDPMWYLEGFTIPAGYAGQTITVKFLVATDEALPTLFRIDEVSLMAYTTSGSGLEEMEQSFVTVSPNPTENSLNIKSSTSHIGEITVLDIRGNKVMNLDINSYSADIDVSNLNKGVYFIMNNEGKKNKFIKI